MLLVLSIEIILSITDRDNIVVPTGPLAESVGYVLIATTFNHVSNANSFSNGTPIIPYIVCRPNCFIHRKSCIAASQLSQLVIYVVNSSRNIVFHRYSIQYKVTNIYGGPKLIRFDRLNTPKLVLVKRICHTKTLRKCSFVRYLLHKYPTPCSIFGKTISQFHLQVRYLIFMLTVLPLKVFTSIRKPPGRSVFFQPHQIANTFTALLSHQNSLERNR